MRVMIWGCGPAGLLAAHAAEQAGADEIRIVSKKVKSPMGGAQYLHEPIPGLTEEAPHGIVSYAKLGSSSGYADKVYGTPTAPTSWEKFPVGDYPAYSMEKVYNELWRKYEIIVLDATVSPEEVGAYCRNNDLVISTVPRPLLCYKDHSFRKQMVFFAPKSFVTIENMIVYNGREGNDWYRTSSLFGHRWTEYSEKRVDRATIPWGWSGGVKPLGHDCDCHDEHENLVFAGRFGRWEKGILVHHAYHAALAAMTVPA